MKKKAIEPYKGQEQFSARPGALDAFKLPSLMDGKRVYPGKRVSLTDTKKSVKGINK